jgi:crotonobetainyl-CoA:carnitine CoA-transferase CaiB-like acyl-CoA transferase
MFWNCVTSEERTEGHPLKPLNGIRILDLSRVVSGPFCTMILGDLGAEIIKVEEPASGDDSRAFGPPFMNGESAYFLSVNRNKKSCCIDLKSDDGKRLVLDLVRHADVIVENFRPGTMERLGLGPDVLAEANPRLVQCSITGFGKEGPDADRPGYDLIIQGESGIMDITGFPDAPPTKIGTSVADLVTGLYAVQAILAAVIERTRTGRGCTVDIAMLDCMASLLTFNAGIYFATGQAPVRRGNAHPTIVPYETFRTSDGWVNLGVANDKFWRLFCEVIDAPDLVEDLRFRDAPDRVANRADLLPRVEAILLKQPRAYWLSRLIPAGVPCGAIRSVGEVCDAEQLVSRGMVATLLHETAGEVRNILTPFRFNGQPTGSHAAPPRLGQHTEATLASFADIGDETFEELCRRGVVRQATRVAP